MLLKKIKNDKEPVALITFYEGASISRAENT